MSSILLGNENKDYIKKKGITINYEDSYIEFYVAGFTKKCKGIHVQRHHARLFNNAVMLSDTKDVNNKTVNIVEIEWPFGNRSTDMAQVFLTREPDNKFDPNAIIVSVSYPIDINKYLIPTSEPLSTFNFLLGYVPKALLSSRFFLLQSAPDEKRLHSSFRY